MIKAVVKHSYVKGSKGAGKARAHINYIAYRHGEDRGKEPRAFFDKEDDRITGRQIKERIDEQDSRGVVMHKIILSPGLETANVQDYTREMMERLEREKGQRLEWYAVEHRNTEHPHAHVVVMGRDLDGGKVRLDLSDMKDLRRWGDRYLEREHALERYLDREKERLLEDRTYRRDRGDALFERLMYGDQGDRKRSAKEIERDRREWEQLDRDMHKTFSRERGRQRKMSFRQYQTESAGRLLTFHEKYQSREARERWEKLANEDPSLAAAAQRELDWMDRFELDSKLDNRGPYDEFDLDRLTDGLTRIEREDRKLIDLVMSEMERDERLERDERQQQQERGQEHERQRWTIDDLLGPRHQRKEKEQEHEQESTVGPAWETFERDRQQQDQMEPEDEREKDRERDDDIFGR